MGGGGVNLSPNFICKKSRKSNKIMHCVDFFLGGSSEDMGIFHVFQLSFDGGGDFIDP